MPLKVNLIYPNGATYTTNTATVADLLTALKSVADPVNTPVFLLDELAMGKIPLKILGEVLDPTLTPAISFQVAQVVDLE